LREALVTAAWLHDVGYGPALRQTGFHSLDGATYFDRHGWPPRIGALVAHHSSARFVAQAVGLSSQARVRHLREPYLLAVADRFERLLMFDPCSVAGIGSRRA
jgi:HD superfamily phosphodiesterase